MSVIFDVFTGQIIDTGSGGSSGGGTIGTPVTGGDPNSVLIVDNAGNLADVPLSDGEIVIGSSSGEPAASTLTGTIDQIDVTNGPNSITLSLPQDIAPSSSPTFAGLTVDTLTGPIKGSSGVLSASAIDLASSEVTGILPVPNGGTGRNTLTNANLLLGNTTSPVNFLAPGSDGDIVVSNTGNFIVSPFDSLFASSLSTRDTDDLSEGVTNLYFTDARAQSAVVIDSIADGDVDHAPSRNSVYDALALKANLASPALTGTPTSPTAAPLTNNTQIATTAYADSSSSAAASAIIVQTINNGDTTHVPSSDVVFDQLALKEALANKNQNNGYAGLDAGGKILSSQLPSTVMEYKGNWDASTNTPTLANGVGDAGDVYRANVAGTTDFGAGGIAFAIGDWAVYSGSIWEKSINSNTVVSVNGQQGIVLLDTDDVPEGSINLYYTQARFDTAFAAKNTDNLSEGATNKYFTDVRAQTAVISQVITNGVIDKSPSEDAVFDALALKQNLLINSAGLAAALSDETGTGFAVFSNSPALSGTPTAPTPSPLDNSTKIATTAYVDAATGASAITALTGDVTATGPGSAVATLATVNANVGTFGTATQVGAVTVNAKGLVTAASNVSIQITESQVTNLVSDLALKAPLASPVFTGTPVAPTPTPLDNSTKLATTAYVDAAIAAGVVGDIPKTSWAGLANNTANQNITGLVFASTISSFDCLMNIFIDATTDTYTTIKLVGTRMAPSDWSVNDCEVEYTGSAITGLDFNITSAGQVQITIGNIAGFTSGSTKFRAITVS